MWYGPDKFSQMQWKPKQMACIGCLMEIKRLHFRYSRNKMQTLITRIGAQNGIHSTIDGIASVLGE